MPDMDVRRGRIEACFNAQRLAGLLSTFQLFQQFFFPDDFYGAPTDVFELFLNRNCFEVVHILRLRSSELALRVLNAALYWACAPRTRLPSISQLPDKTNSIASE